MAKGLDGIQSLSYLVNELGGIIYYFQPKIRPFFVILQHSFETSGKLFEYAL